MALHETRNGVILLAALFSPALTAQGRTLSVVWDQGGGAEKQLKTWQISSVADRNLAGLAQAGLPKKSHQILDTQTGKTRRMEGVLLSAVVDEAIKDLTPEERSRIDLVVLKSSDGQKAEVPRSFITHFPVILAEAGQETGLRSAIPWPTSRDILSEGLPVQNYALSPVQTIELTSYRQKFDSRYFVQVRSDPVLIRGEKRFIQSCMGCHSGNGGRSPLPGFSQISTFIDEGKLTTRHSAVAGMPKMNELDQRALRKYIQAVLTQEKAE